MEVLDKFRKARQIFEVELQRELKDDKLWSEVFPLIDKIREITNEIEIILVKKRKRGEGG